MANRQLVSPLNRNIANALKMPIVENSGQNLHVT